LANCERHSPGALARLVQPCLLTLRLWQISSLLRCSARSGFAQSTGPFRWVRSMGCRHRVTCTRTYAGNSRTIHLYSQPVVQAAEPTIVCIVRRTQGVITTCTVRLPSPPSLDWTVYFASFLAVATSRASSVVHVERGNVTKGGEQLFAVRRKILRKAAFFRPTRGRVQAEVRRQFRAPVRELPLRL
jgi:hypothetical protein